MEFKKYKRKGTVELHKYNSNVMYSDEFMNKLFITIEFADIPGAFDYPKHLPLPKKEDIVHFNGKFGKVEVVKHMTEGSVTDIRIICCRL